MRVATLSQTRAPVIDGHRRLLEVVREFAGGSEGERTCDDLEAARALVAFLRQELFPFAACEEERLRVDPAERETTMFEHAFLAAEIDGLSRAVDAARIGFAASVPRVGRAIHRIEAVLEMHVERHEDRQRDSDVHTASLVANPSVTVHGHARTNSARLLNPDTIDALLRRNWWGVLSTVHEGSPYAVPVAYGMVRGSFHFASRHGRKIRNLVANPRACLTVTEVADGSAWSSVVVTGDVEWVDDPAGVVRTLRALARQCGRQAATRPTDARRIMGAKLFRLVPREITGRARNPQDHEHR